MPDLLLELLSEEIPARMQKKAREDLAALIGKGLKEAGVTHDAVSTFSTPRRLTLRIEGLPERTPDISEERKGPRTDAPEKALEGFLRSTGLSKEQLEVRDDKKGEVYFAKIEKPGEPLADLIARIVPEVIRGFPWPKSMRWGSSDLRWVRPLTSILCLLDDKSVPFEIESYVSGNETRGHRMVDPEPFIVDGFAAYRDGLAARGVTLEPDARETTILEGAQAHCAANGVTLVEDRGLLAENAGLTEMPIPIIGEIEEQFRSLPPEVLQTSMREHQKFFSAKDGSGRVTHFIAVANVKGDDGGETILKGNAKVLRARLSDAKFFWENDLRAVKRDGFAAMAAPLTNVTDHAQLGTVADKVDRMAALARQIAPAVGADPAQAEGAARVAKADLASEMVYEFPELQGLMGRYYASEAGLDPKIAAACEDHYKPLGPTDDVPNEPVSVAVALAEKIDTLTGFWAIDEKPTGSKDPYALRRAALGVIRLILENEVRLPLRIGTASRIGDHLGRMGGAQIGNCAREAAEALRAAGQDVLADTVLQTTLSGAPGSQMHIAVEEITALAVTLGDDLLSFITERLKVALKADGVRHDLIDAVTALGGQDDLVLLVKRVEALQSFLATEDGTNLLAGYKRAANILAAEEKKGALPEGEANYQSDGAPQTVVLSDALQSANGAIITALEAEDFETAMREMASLRDPIDSFFDGVMVNDPDPDIRFVRISLLMDIRDTMGRIADFSKIEGGG